MEAEIRSRTRTEQQLRVANDRLETQLRQMQADQGEMAQKHQKLLEKMSELAYINDALRNDRATLRQGDDRRLLKSPSADRSCILPQRRNPRNFSMFGPCEALRSPVPNSTTKRTSVAHSHLGPPRQTTSLRKAQAGEPRMSTGRNTRRLGRLLSDGRMAFAPNRDRQNF